MSTVAPENILEKSLPMLADQNWVSFDGFFHEEELSQLLQAAEKKWDQGDFRSAQIGRSGLQKINQEIRSDSTCWVDEKTLKVDFFWRKMSLIQRTLNQHFFLGIQNFEAHFARYESGQRYDRHIDQSPLKSALHGERLITFIVYLNKNWRASDAGELCIYQDSQEALIAPTWGKVILFKSDAISHSVQASHGLRWSLTGWFRRS
jgi:SM-20-related protein